MSKRPDYINPPEKWKKLSPEEMRVVLKEIKRKNTEYRNAAREGISELLRNGFICY